MPLAAMVLGIVGLVAMFVPVPFVGPLLSIVLCVLAIVLGAVGRKKAVASQEPTGMATAGLVMGIIGASLAALVLIACSTCLGVGCAGCAKVMDEAQKEAAKQAKREGGTAAVVDDTETAKAIEKVLKEAQENAEKESKKSP